MISFTRSSSEQLPPYMEGTPPSITLAFPTNSQIGREELQTPEISSTVASLGQQDREIHDWTQFNTAPTYVREALNVDSSETYTVLAQADEENIFTDTIDLRKQPREIEDIIFNSIDEDCIICSGKVTGIKVILICKHFFHYDCVFNQIQQTRACPTCESFVDVEHIECTMETRTKKTCFFFKGYTPLLLGSLLTASLLIYFFYYRPKFE